MTNTRKLQMTLASTALAAGLTLSANAAIVSYSYAYDVMPAFSGGGGLYLDDLHSGPAGTFDSTGDLNDGIIYNGGNPVTDGGGVNSMLAWDPTPAPATITVDLGGLYNLNSIDLTTYAFAAFNLGYADDVTISTSTDNITYGNSTLHSLSTAGDGANTNNIVRSDTGVRYIQLAFDGSTSTGDKWGLTELSIDGTAIPEPSSAALFGIAGLGLILRRRR